MKRLRVSTSHESLREELGRYMVIAAQNEANRKLQEIRQLIQNRDWSHIGPCPLCDLPCDLYEAEECPECRDVLACNDCALINPFYSCSICNNSLSDKEQD